VTAEGGHGRKGGHERKAVSAETESEMRKRLNEWVKGEPIAKDEADFIQNIFACHFMFKVLPASALRMLCERMEKRTFKEGETLAAQGETANEMFVVYEGGFDVEVTKKGEEKAIKVAHCGNGSSLGEMALLYDTNRTASLVASAMGGESTVFALPRALYQLTLMGKTNNETSMKKRSLAEQSTQEQAISRAAWLEEGMSEMMLDELSTRMRRTTVNAMFARPTAAVLVLVEEGSLRFSGDAASRESAARRGADLRTDAMLEAGDALVIGAAGAEGLLAAMYETYRTKAVNADENNMPKLRLLGGSHHACNVSDMVVESRLLYIPLDELFPLFSLSDSLLSQRDCVRSLLCMSPWMSDFPAKELEALVFGFKPMHLHEGETLIEFGSEVTSMYLVVRGMFKVSRHLADGTTSVVCQAETGDVLGEYATATGEAAAVSVVASADAVVLQLDRDSLKSSPFAMAKAAAGEANRQLSKPRLSEVDLPLSALSCIAVIGMVRALRVDREGPQLWC